MLYCNYRWNGCCKIITKKKSRTFASFADIFNQDSKTCQLSLRFMFDIYKSPSINDIKRKSRGDRDRENIYNYDIQHILLADFTELLNPSDFKTQFLRFLFKEYEDLVYGPIIGEKVLYRLMDNEYKSLIKTICCHLKRDMSCMVTILKLIPVSCSM